MKRFCIILLAIFLSSCATPSTPPTATITPTYTPAVTETASFTLTPACVSPVPAQSDIDRVLSYTGDVLASGDWTESHEVLDDRVSVTWQNIPQGAVIFLEAKIFPCGYEEPDLNQYFNEEYWNVLFQNYESHELVSQCRSEIGLRLYQFKATSQGYEYNIRYWSQSDTDTRVITTMITFPVGAESALDDYSGRLFPKLPNCS
ncbi:MAG: hypothetical protein U0Z26_12900 [Anaerolineales bacterium]